MQRTDDNVHVPVPETRRDQDTADLFLLATRPRGQIDVHVVGPFEPHARTSFGTQRPLIAARVDDGQSGEVLHECKARCGERRCQCRCRCMQRRADEDRELQATRWREPRVGAAAAPCELERGEGDDRCRERRLEARISAIRDCLFGGREGRYGVAYPTSIVCVLVTASP